MQTVKTTLQLLKRCQATRFGFHLANKMNVIRSYSNSPLSPTELIEEIHKYETKNGNNTIKKLRLKPFEAMLIALDAMRVLRYKDGKVEKIIADAELKDLLSEIKDLDPDLMSCEDLIMRTFREGGPDANTFMKEMEGIRKFEAKMQDIIIKNIVGDIRQLYERQKKELGSKEKGMARKLRIVDVGCGIGKFDYALAEELKCAEINACDINQDVLKIAIKGKPKHLTHLEFTEKPKWKKGEVDVVLLMNVAHDAVNPKVLIKEVSEMLHGGGIAIIVDPLVSTDRKKNHLNPQIVSSLCIGFFGCVLSTDCNHAKGPATGKEELLKCIHENGMSIRDQKLLANSKFYHGFIAVKWNTKKTTKDILEELFAM